MGFGLFYQLRFPEPWSSEKEQKCLWEAIEQITYAEEMGFEGLMACGTSLRPSLVHCQRPRGHADGHQSTDL